MKIDLSNYNFDVITGAGLCNKIASYGYEAYLVGGCVRDIVMETIGVIAKADVHDVDIATNMPINELNRKFKTASNNGEAHGTILVEWCGIYFEVTQFRTDGVYTDGRHPDSVSFTNSFKEDTARRDFTINAMGIDSKGNVIDYHGGIDDINNGVIRTVGNPVDRFSEDALRIIRACRFAAKFKFTIDPDTCEAIRTTKSNLTHIAMERVSDELKKCIHYGHEYIAAMWTLMSYFDIFPVIDPNDYINYKKAGQLLSGRCIRYTNNMGDFFTELGTWTCILYNSDLKNAYQYYKLENNTFKCTQWCSNHILDFKNIGDSSVAAVDMVNNKYFNQLRELADAVYGHRLKQETLDRYYKLADVTKDENSILSSAVAKCGYQGKAFGNMLYELRRWHYFNVFHCLVTNGDYTLVAAEELEKSAIDYINHIKS